ncbi:MAG TPA: CbiM family transporter [Urbifossiella sp.]|jgi:cobalt/nickel transport system permease protein|nr:CbiM family transporter [Urbifossiella sp.]
MGLSVLAVHLSDGAVSPAWLAGGFGAAAALVAAACWRLPEDRVPRIGVLTAAFFIASTVHIKLVLLPTTVHLILNGLVGVTLGPRAPLAVAVGLALQYLLLAHGGLTTLGLNTCIIALPAVAAGASYPLLRRAGVPPFGRGVILGAAAVAGAAVLNFLALLLGGQEDWSTLARLVLLAHLPVVVVEGLILGVVVRYLEKVKPDMLGG